MVATYDSPDETPINEFWLSVRARNCLLSEGLSTAGDVRRTKDWQLLGIPNLGLATLAEIRHQIRGHPTPRLKPLKPPNEVYIQQIITYLAKYGYTVIPPR